MFGHFVEGKYSVHLCHRHHTTPVTIHHDHGGLLMEMEVAGAAMKMGLKVFTLLDLRDILFRLMDISFHNLQQIVNITKHVSDLLHIKWRRARMGVCLLKCLWLVVAKDNKMDWPSQQHTSSVLDREHHDHWSQQRHQKSRAFSLALSSALPTINFVVLVISHNQRVVSSFSIHTEYRIFWLLASSLQLKFFTNFL